MAKKITQYPASSGNPDVGSVFDISELSNGNYTSKKITLSQLLNYMNANLTFNTGVKQFLNDTASTLLAGSLVSIYGANTTNASVDTNVDANQIMGQLYVAIENISGESVGDFISEGVVNNLNTSAYVTGTKLFWDFLNNTFTNIPNANGATIFYGIVLVQSSSVGSIYVSPTYDFKQNIAGESGEVALFQYTDKLSGNTRFTYVNNLGTEVGYRIEDGLSNLTQIGISYVNVETQGASQSSVLRLANYSDDIFNKGLISFRKARGNKINPTKVLPNDVLGAMIFTGQADKLDGNLIRPSGMTTAEILVRAMDTFTKTYNENTSETFATGLTQYEIWLQKSNGYTETGDFTPPNIKVFSVDGNGKVSFKNYTFPISNGTAGQVLTANSDGIISWTTPTTGGSLTGSGASNRIAYWNSADSLTSSDYLTASVVGSSPSDYGRIEVKSSPNLGTTYQSIYLGSFDSTTNSNGRSAQLNLKTIHEGTATNPLTTETRITLNYAPTDSNAYPISNDKLGSISFLSKGSKASGITAVSNENHSQTNKGTKLEFYVCKDATMVDFNALTLDSDGRVIISNAYKLPLTDGTANQVLATDANGNVSWSNPSNDIWTLPHHGQQRGLLWSPATTSKQNIGNDAGTVVGTPVAKTPTSGNELSERISCKISVSSPAVNGTAYVRGTSTYYFRTGGMLFSCGFAVSDTGYNETSSMFCGLKDTATMALNYTAPATLGNSLWNMFNIIGVGNDGYCASITGSVSGTTLTISAISYGTIQVGQSFSTSIAGTRILSQLTGTPNGIGTYEINISQTITNSTMRVFDPNLCIIYNDNTGNAVKIPLGDKFPANRTSGAVNTNNFYIFEMYFPPANPFDGAVRWRIKNTYNDVTPLEASGTIINNIVANQYPLNYHMYRSSMGNSNACSFDISHIFCSNLS